MKNNNIDILYKNECTGCSVCRHICPHNAINMSETKEGFHYPTIDYKKCTNCGLCVKKCHAINDNFKTEYKQKIYDVRANDDIRMKSSSGGMFSLVANYVLENDGYVCGASFTKDWLGVEHIIINDKKELDKLRGSKYIESNLNSTFINIKNLLEEQKQVLFTGCPCQVSALTSYLNKTYDNLITMDLICNSIVPNKLWIKYLKEVFTEDEIKKIEYVCFRNKEKFGWNTGLYIKLENKEYIDKENLYIKILLEHIGVKEECIHCKYSRFERCSDITIGDFWGTEKPDNKGVSLVFINTTKGNDIFNKVKINSQYEYFSEYKHQNGGLGIVNNPIFCNRKYFFDNLDKESLKELYINSYNPKYNIAIISMMFSNNFGGVLTYYALFYVLKNLGYNPILIYDNIVSNNLYDDVKGCKLALKYLNVGNDIFNKDELKKYIDKCDIFMVGSDQVWRMKKFHYLFDFIPCSKKKISYSTSFGIDHYDGNIEEKILFKYYLKQFDFVSVREDDGVNICKNYFDVNACHVLDPVFLLEERYYNYLMSNTKLNIDYDYIAVYSLYSDEELSDTISYISDKLNMNAIFINNNNSIEDFIYIIKNAKFLITDSFHGSCFAIIFNITFLVILNEFAGSSRIYSLLRQFNLSDRIIKRKNDIIDNYLESINFEYINKKLEIEKEKSLKWLENALSTPKKNNENLYLYDLVNLLIEKNIQLNNKMEESNIQLNNKIEKSNIQLNNKIEESNIQLNNKIEENKNWVRLFGIYNDKYYIYIYILGIKIIIKINKDKINKIAWWIPVKKYRDNFRNKFNTDQTRPDQTRPDQTRPDQTRPDQTRPDQTRPDQT